MTDATSSPPVGVTRSTKCWEGDYRRLLEPTAFRDLFRALGPADRTQLVLNRIEDRADADARVARLRDEGLVDDVAWAEDAWPRVAGELGIPATWFGAAWPYSAPELVELSLARTPVVAHLAGDVRIEDGDAWLDRALPALERAAAVSPASPSRIELRRADARIEADGWVTNGEFSDQCFVVRRADLLAPAVMRATDPHTHHYPKPGGALTFEARVGAWLRSTGGVRLIDTRRSYRHPVGSVEGSAYGGVTGPREHLPPLPVPSAGYPAAGSVDATALVVARDAVRSIGWTVTSLRWCREVVVVDQASTDGTAARAEAAGATVHARGRSTGIAREAWRDEVAGRTGWVVLVEPDEIVPPALARTIAAHLVDDVDGVDGVEVATRTFTLGRELHAPPQYELRVVRAGRAVLPWGIEATRERVTLVAGARSTRIPAGEGQLVRLRRPDLHAWLDEANTATTLEARGTHVPSGDVSLRRAAKRFAEVYVGERAWREGRAGWRRALVEAMTRWLLTEKAHAAIDGGATTVLARYEQLAHDLIEGGAT